MAKEGDYTIKDVYGGGYSALDPNKNYGSVFSGYQTTAGSVGLSTDARTANIIQEVSKNLSAGAKAVELSQVFPEVFDAIPKQQLKEVNQLSKLTGIDISLHGPVIDTIGMTREGFSEVNREASERKIAEAIQRGQEIDPKGNMPIVFHSSGEVPGTEWETLGKDKKARRMIGIDRESGKMIPLEKEKKYYPGEAKVEAKEYTAEENLQVANDTEWSNSIKQIEFSRENAERIMADIHPSFRNQYLKAISGQLDRAPSAEELEQFKRIHSASEYTEDSMLNARAVFDKAYKSAKRDDDQKMMNYLNELSDEYGKTLGVQGLDKMSKQEQRRASILSRDPKTQSEAMFKLTQGLQQIQPRLVVPIDEFAVEQSAKTFGNAAFEAYKKFGEKAPVVCIENPPFGSILSTGEDLKNVVEESRKRFVEKAREEGISKGDAKRVAENLIGATWDLGHINMLRKAGFGKKEIIEETEKIAPFVKHVHLSDNFGFEHTELPMGMGNVPMKEIMGKLGKEGFKGRKIVEALSWWQHFKTPPLVQSFEALGSPIYAEGVGPYWNQAYQLHQGYFSGYGETFPQIHYETFGGGFGQLPSELGGQRPGAQGGRMSGKPME